MVARSIVVEMTVEGTLSKASGGVDIRTNDVTDIGVGGDKNLPAPR